jgi:hypothetical protein
MLVLLAAAGTMLAQQIHLSPAVSQSRGMGNVPMTSGDDVQKKQTAAANQQPQLEIRRHTEKMLELTSGTERLSAEERSDRHVAGRRQEGRTD